MSLKKSVFVGNCSPFFYTIQQGKLDPAHQNFCHTSKKRTIIVKPQKEGALTKKASKKIRALARVRDTRSHSFIRIIVKCEIGFYMSITKILGMLNDGENSYYKYTPLN